VFGPDFQFLARSELLSFEEITRVARLAAPLGVRKVRLTGGEPLLRRELERLVAMLVQVPGIEDVAITTNGILLAKRAAALARAGLARVTVSLDALEQEVFERISDTRAPLARVLAGIDAAHAAGLAPVKVNMVVRGGVNEHCVLAMAEHFRASPHVLRFIEYMDVGETNGWRAEEVVPGREILAMIGERWPLEPLAPTFDGEVATRFAYRDGAGEIGVIASVTEPFCGGCTRARLSSEGQLYTCLFASNGVDLRALLRGGADDREISTLLESTWRSRGDRYSELRTERTARRVREDASRTSPRRRGDARRIEMSYIGG